jgi:hypothetical protein
VATTSVPPPVVGICLTACSNADDRHCARRVLQYVQGLKDAEAVQEGNRSSFTTSSFFANFIIYNLVALTAWLGAAKKVLSEEKIAQLAPDRSLAEEKATRQIAEQSRQAFEEAKAALA